MALADELIALRAKAQARVGPEVFGIMTRAVDELQQSGIVERSLKVGDRAPEFSLPDALGQTVHSKDLLAAGPLVVSFYRGGW